MKHDDEIKIRLPRDVKLRFQEMASLEGLGVSAAVRWLVESIVNDADGQGRNFLRQIRESLEDEP